MSEAADAKMLEIQTILQDYSDILWDDTETRNHVLNLVSRFYETGQDVNEAELTDLVTMLKKKINEFVKTKGN